MQNWHGTLLLWGVILLGLTINSAIGSLLAKFVGLLLVLHLLGFFAIILPLALLSEHGDSAAVFNNFYNLGEWHMQGISLCVGLFATHQCHVQMAEEIRDAAVVIPRSLLTGLAINGVLGFAMLIVTLYCVAACDIDAVFAENPSYPFMAILRNAVASTAAAVVMSSVIVAMAFSAITGCLCVHFAVTLGLRSRSWASWVEGVDEDESAHQHSPVRCFYNNYYRIHIVLGPHWGRDRFQWRYIHLIAGLLPALLLYRRLRGQI